jgi:hypothetical protein
LGYSHFQSVWVMRKCSLDAREMLNKCLARIASLDLGR